MCSYIFYLHVLICVVVYVYSECSSYWSTGEFYTVPYKWVNNYYAWRNLKKNVCIGLNNLECCGIMGWAVGYTCMSERDRWTSQGMSHNPMGPWDGMDILRHFWTPMIIWSVTGFLLCWWTVGGGGGTGRGRGGGRCRMTVLLPEQFVEC